MNDGPGLNLTELRRQLTDLAEWEENEQPWDDPLPYVFHAAAAADPEDDLGPQRDPGPFATARGRAARINWRRFSPVSVVSVAAVLVVVAMVGLFLHGSGGSDSKESAESGPAASVAAAATGRAQAQPAPTSGAATGKSAGAGSSACETLSASSRLAISAPAELVQRDVLSVRVTTSGGIRLTSPTIVVRLESGAVIGRLVPTVVTPTPTSSGPVGSFVVTGRLVRTSLSCDDLPGHTVPVPPSPLAAALPAGHYQLVVTGSTRTGRVASAPVAITINP